ncbi:hypothetical protein ABFY27_01860 [Akkermansia massiliensis]
MKAVFSKSPQDAAFIKAFLQDPAWMELYLGAGLIPENSPEGLQILSDLWKADGRSADFRDYQSLATGLASVFSTGPMAGKLKTNSANSNPVRRYQIFKKLHQENKLHPGFIKLRPWEMRFVVGHTWDDKSYEWSNEHVNLPGGAIRTPAGPPPTRETTSSATPSRAPSSTCRGATSTPPRKTLKSSAASAAASPTSAPWRPRPTASRPTRWGSPATAPMRCA